MLSITVGALQFMLDRGAEKDWFQSAEILIELGLVIACGWMFVVHTIMDREPFLDKRLFMDRNFTSSILFIFVIGIILLATMALLPPMLQTLFGYPVVTVGIVLAPRGIGTLMAMMVVGRLVRKIDPRLLVTVGLACTAYSLYAMTYFSLEMNYWPVVWTGVIQGFGLGFVFVPLTTIAFTTLDPRLRTDATSLFNLVRNLGSSIGVSIVAAALAANAQTNHASLAAQITPFNGNLAAAGIVPSLLTTPFGAQQAAELDGMINAQSLMISYLDDFKLMFLITLLAAPLIVLLRYRPVQGPAAGPPVVAAAD
jgi:DHA2 family multidrug resistance protein